MKSSYYWLFTGKAVGPETQIRQSKSCGVHVNSKNKSHRRFTSSVNHFSLADGSLVLFELAGSLGQLLLQLGEVVVVASDAALADVEVALPAVVELAGLSQAEVAWPRGLELGQLELMLVVAGLQINRPALEAVVLFLLPPLPPLHHAEHALQLYDLLLLAVVAEAEMVLRPSDVGEHVVLVALRYDRPLLVASHRLAVVEAERT